MDAEHVQDSDKLVKGHTAPTGFESGDCCLIYLELFSESLLRESQRLSPLCDPASKQERGRRHAAGG